MSEKLIDTKVYIREGEHNMRAATPLDLAIRGFIQTPNDISDHTVNYMVAVKCAAHPSFNKGPGTSGKIPAIKAIRQVVDAKKQSFPQRTESGKLGLREAKLFVEGSFELKISLADMSNLEKEGWRFSHSETEASTDLVSRLESLENYYRKALEDLRVRRQDLIGSMSAKCEPAHQTDHQEGEHVILGRTPQWSDWDVDEG